MSAHIAAAPRRELRSRRLEDRRTEVAERGERTREKSSSSKSRRSRTRRKDDDDVEIEYVPLSQWISERAIFHDEKAGIYPWGFKDKDLESKFQEHFGLTFANNSRRPLMWCCLALTVKNIISIGALAKANVAALTWTTVAFNSLVYRLGISVSLTYAFSQKIVPRYAKLLYRAVFLWRSWWITCPLALSEGLEYSRRLATLPTVVIVAIFAFANALRAGSWIQATVASLFVCAAVIVRYFLALQAQNNRWKYALTFHLLLFALVAAISGIVFNAFVQVSRRIEWYKLQRRLKKEPKPERTKREKRRLGLGDVSESDQETEEEEDSDSDAVSVSSGSSASSGGLYREEVGSELSLSPLSGLRSKRVPSREQVEVNEEMVPRTTAEISEDELRSRSSSASMSTMGRSRRPVEGGREERVQRWLTQQGSERESEGGGEEEGEGARERGEEEEKTEGERERGQSETGEESREEGDRDRRGEEKGRGEGGGRKEEEGEKEEGGRER